jgi:small subunit ribosomal protein S9
VFLRPGTGTITVNHREFANYFPTDQLRMNVRRPLVLTENVDKFDVLATVAGGGVNSQSGAVRLGIARALLAFNAELRRALKKDGLLTSDSRVKERKKYGLAGARKRFQFSKR